MRRGFVWCWCDRGGVARRMPSNSNVEFNSTHFRPVLFWLENDDQRVLRLPDKTPKDQEARIPYIMFRASSPDLLPAIPLGGGSYQTPNNTNFVAECGPICVPMPCLEILLRLSDVSSEDDSSSRPHLVRSRAEQREQPHPYARR